MKGREVPPKADNRPVVTVIAHDAGELQTVYLGGVLWQCGECEIDLYELLRQAGAHVHYLDGFDQVYPIEGEWPELLSDALLMPSVIWLDEVQGAYRLDYTQTLAVLNEVKA